MSSDRRHVLGIVKAGVTWLGTLMVAVMATQFVPPERIATAAGGALLALLSLFGWTRIG